MNRFLLLLLLILITDQTFGQTDQELAIENALHARTITELEHSKGKYRFTQVHSDKLNLGLVQTNWQLGKRKKKSHIGLLTLSKDNNIIYLEVYNWDFNEDYTDWKHETVELWTSQEFDSNVINPKHLIRLPYRSTFGYECGAGAAIPTEGHPILDLIEDKNFNELTNWLNSLNPVRQAYGYFGFSVLEIQGTELDTATRNKMDQLKFSDFPVYHCSGCTEWGTVTLSDLLTDEEVQRFILFKMD